MNFLGWYRDWRHEMCDATAPTYAVTDDPADVDLQLDTLDGVLALAGSQKIQSTLPEATKVVWRAVAKAFPNLTGLGGWGDRSHQARKSCHNSGKAIDCMTSDPSLHSKVVAWALANRGTLGITLIISRRQKWSAATGWKPAPYRGTSAHTDHVHLSVRC